MLGEKTLSVLAKSREGTLRDTRAGLFSISGMTEARMFSDTLTSCGGVFLLSKSDISRLL